MTAKTILVADDDAHIRDIIQFALERAGFQVELAENGQAALECCGSGRIDLVVLDIAMPELDGLAVCRQLRKASELPILFLSARDEEIDRVLGLELGGDDYLTKPFSPRELVARVQAILKRSAPPPPAPPAARRLQRKALSLDLDRYSALWHDRPLTAIQGAIELIGEHGATMPNDTRERFLANIRGDTDRLRRLTERLLELAHADVLVGRGESYALAPLLDRLKSAYDGRLLVVPQRRGRAPDRLAIAPDIAETVFGNLLENSRQHGASTVTITLEAAEIGDRLILSFADDGTGISPGNAENLFQPFFTTRRGAGGTGLGLAIARSLLAAYGGEIRHQPTASGTCFRIELPATAAADLATLKQ
jgi:two-component system, OmpR family, response regulator